MRRVLCLSTLASGHSLQTKLRLPAVWITYWSSTSVRDLSWRCCQGGWSEALLGWWGNSGVIGLLSRLGSWWQNHAICCWGNLSLVFPCLWFIEEGHMVTEVWVKGSGHNGEKTFDHMGSCYSLVGHRWSLQVNTDPHIYHLVESKNFGAAQSQRLREGL